MAIEIPRELFELYYETVDMFDSAAGFGVRCRLVYPPANIECPNCIIDTMTGRSSNVYKDGGEIPFDQGECPFCGGQGKYYQEVTEDIFMRLYFNSDLKNNSRLGDFKVISGGISMAAGDALTYGQIADMPKVKRAIYVILAADQMAYETFKYQLLAEPALHGFGKSNYFKAAWKRIQ